MATCGLCVPLRLGNFLSAASALLLATVFVLIKTPMANDIRPIFGGYSVATRATVALLMFASAVAGFVGLVGIYKLRIFELRFFVAFLYARAVTMAFVLALDLGTLMACERWIGDINAAMNVAGGFSPMMYETAFSGRCFADRLTFGISGVVQVAIYAYLAHAGTRFLRTAIASAKGESHADMGRPMRGIDSVPAV